MNVPVRKNETALQQLPEGYDASTQSLAVSLAIAEVDQQVTTAHAYPRSIEVAMKHIMSLATLDGETAQECVYALPRAGKAIKGPSIRLAEVIQGQWGNNRVGTRIVHVDRIEKYVEAEGVFHDLETNSATTARVRRRISDSKGRLFNDDMIIVTGNAASAIAKRNAILAGVPKAVWRRAYAAVEQVLVGDVKTLVERRGEAMKAFAAFGIKPEQLFAALEVEGLDDIGLDHMSSLIGMHSALKSGEATVEEMFPATRAKTEKPGDLASRLDRLADEGVSSGPPAASTAADEGGGDGAQQTSAAADGSPVDLAGVGGDERPAPPATASSPPQDPGGFLRSEDIAEVLQIATRADLEAEDRLDRLDALRPDLLTRYSHPLVNTLIVTGGKVVTKGVTKGAAAKYLAGLKDG
jgi:hypothetical protein